MSEAAPETFLAWLPCSRPSSRSPFSGWAAAGLSPDSIASTPILVVRKQPVIARAFLVDQQL